MYRCNRSYADLVFADLGVFPFLLRSLTIVHSTKKFTASKGKISTT
jgi:hypothetical protein